MSETRFCCIHCSGKKRKEQLQDDLKSMLGHNDLPTTWEADGKVVELAWDKIMEITSSHSEKARQRFKD